MLFNPPVNSKIQGLFKAFECCSSTVKSQLSERRLSETTGLFEDGGQS